VQYPHPPLLVGAGGRRMLELAAREADIVGFLMGNSSTGVEIDDPQLRIEAAVEQRLAWVRQAAGERSKDLELSLVLTAVLTDDRHQAARHIREAHTWSDVSVQQILQMPSFAIGSYEQIVDLLYERRERYGFSYAIVADHQMQQFAPVVARLAGQ
jgi:alkanesulfonate monooxygenase SsuD/methylene tetrahydromethanopterin reductase-like flavin-dependent oxidoreductase (luciferase family)